MAARDHAFADFLIIRVLSDPLPLIWEGKLRPLGVATKTRFASASEIPPIAEAGVPDFDAVVGTMFVAPAHTPREIVSRLHAELGSIVALARNPAADRQDRDDSP
jgi:tripartite-type tricarboxylate transporter receptor subunit TctC